MLLSASMNEVTLFYPPQLFKRWKRTRMYLRWYRDYKSLFTKRDLSNAECQHGGGYHFAEWFTAIHFWQRGYDVLTPKYGLRSNPEKWAAAERILTTRGLRFLTRKKKFDGVTRKRPDLLVFKRGRRTFFFIEVK